MVNFVMTMLSDILMSLQLTRPLEFMSLIICCMLLGSPGTAGTILGAGTKLGIALHLIEERKQHG